MNSLEFEGGEQQAESEDEYEVAVLLLDAERGIPITNFNEMPCPVLLDSGAEANFIDPELVWRFPGAETYKIAKPIIAKSALKGQQRVDTAATVPLPKPFDCELEILCIGKSSTSDYWETNFKNVELSNDRRRRSSRY